MPIPGFDPVTRQLTARALQYPSDVRQYQPYQGQEGQEDWRQAFLKKKQEESGSWWLNAGYRILQLLSAPQYAAMSAVREIGNLIQGDAKTDPLSAAFHGFKAAFTDDQEYMTRTMDVLKAWGYNPEPGTTESRIAAILGFASDVFFDPINLIGVGPAARAFKLSVPTVKKAAQRASIELAPGRLARALSLTEEGGRAARNWLASNRKKMSASGLPADTIRAANEAGAPLSPVQRLIEQAESEDAGLTDIAQLFLPTAGMKVADALAIKTPEKIQRFLSHVGKKKVTKEEIEDFAIGGYQKYVDPGGLQFGWRKWGGGKARVALLAPRAIHDAPSLSRFLGWHWGTSQKLGLNFTSELAAKVTETRPWRWLQDDIIQPGFVQPIKKWAFPLADATPGQRVLFRWMNKIGPESANVARRIVQTILSKHRDDLPAVDQMLRQELPEGMKLEIKPFSKLDRIAGRIALMARTQGYEGDAFKSWARDILAHPSKNAKVEAWYRGARPHRGDHSLPGLGLRNGLTNDEIEAVVESVDAWQRYVKELGQYEQKFGILDSFVDAYTTRMYRYFDRRGWQDPEKVKAFGQRYNFWAQEQKLTQDWDDMAALFRNKEAPGLLEDSLSEIMTARLSTSLASQMTKDGWDRFMLYHAKFPHRAGQLLELMKNPKLLRKAPVFAELVAKTAAEYGAQGVSQVGYDAWSDMLLKINKSLINPSAAKSAIYEFVKKGKGPLNLADANVDDLMGEYDKIIGDLEATVKEGAGVTPGPAAQEKVLNVLKQERSLVKMHLIAEKTSSAFERGMQRVREVQDEALGRIAPESMFIGRRDKEIYRKIVKGKPQSIWTLSPGGRKSAVTRMLSTYGTGIGSSAPAIATASHYLTSRIDAVKAKVIDINKGWKAIKGSPGYAAAAAPLLGKKIVNTATEIEDRMNEIRMQVYELGKAAGTAPRTPAQIAQLELLDIEYRTLSDARHTLPAPGVGRSLEAQVAHLGEKVALIDEITEAAKDLKAEKALSAFVEARAPGKRIEQLTIGELERLVKDIKTPNFGDKVVDYLRAVEPVNEYQPMVDGKPFLVPTPTGAKINATRAMGGTRETFHALSTMREVTANPAPTNLLMAAIDLNTSWFRKLVTANIIPGVPRPTFFLRNMVDNLFRVGMMFGLATHLPWRTGLKDAVGAIAGWTGPLATKDLPIQTYEDLREFIKGTGFWSYDMPRVEMRAPPEIMRTLDEHGGWAYGVARNAKIAVNQWVESRPILKHLTAQRMGADMENLTVALGSLLGMRTGKSISEITDDIHHFLFYYGGMTPLERNFMRRMFVFWSFQRNAIPFTAWTLMKRPELMAVYPKLRDMADLSPQDEALLPEWVRDYPFVKLGDIPGGVRIASMRNVFSTDVLPEMMPTQWANMLTQVNPILLAPIEGMFGRQLYLLRDIPKRKLVSDRMADIEHGPLWLEPFAQWLRAEEVEVKDRRTGKTQKLTAVDGTRYHLLTRTWFSRLFRELDDARDIVQGRMGAGDFAAMLIGFKAIQLERERAMSLLMGEADKALNEYKTALRRGDKTGAEDILEQIRWE